MSSTETRPQRSFHRAVEVMGTVITIDLYGGVARDEEITTRHVDAAQVALQRADEIFSTWKKQSILSRLRRGELSLVDVPDEVLEVLEACRSARLASEGWFDPWSMPGGVDPTGLVKGWAAERALHELRGLELTGAVVNAAGELAVATVMTCTLAVDHRVADGALGATWMRTFKQVVEDPLSLML